MQSRNRPINYIMRLLNKNNTNLKLKGKTKKYRMVLSWKRSLTTRLRHKLPKQMMQM